MSRSRLAILVTLLVGFFCGSRTDAQVRPFLDWHTRETKHFVIHYPSQFAEWTDTLASHLDAEYDAVTRLVGNAPATRVTVMVEDPLSISNGFALPFLDDPLIFVYPLPPEPSDEIGTSRSWPEILSVHEFAHIAHLTTPSRDPSERRLWRLLPVQFSPIAARSPRWVIEGYATYVEGKLTGSGRPHGVWRAAVLRRWALEGQMPRYSQLNGGGDYEQGAMAYLAGSAFLEWLLARPHVGGDSALPHVWRRMTARSHRGFDEAFAGVFGDPPDVLYGRFVAQLTGDALSIQRRLAGGDTGTVVQHLAWSTGAPAVSRDGSRLALELVSRGMPSRVVIWAARDTVDSAALARARARARTQARAQPREPVDSLDVPAVRVYPPPKRALATLRHASGYPFTDPRFIDTARVLLVRNVVVGDGSVVPDLFVWNWRTNVLRRVTHDASIRSADPSPDGRFAIGERCVSGRCDVVRVDLTSGAVHELARGSVTGSYDRPRLSPDGRTIAVALQMRDRWHVVLLEAQCEMSCAPHDVGPDDGASRYDPAFTPDGRALIVVSELGGVPNLERIDLASGDRRTLTRLTGAALAPAPSPCDGSVYFLSLHARGWDVAKVAADSASSPVIALDTALAPAAPLPVVAAPTFATETLPPPRGYGIGPRGWRMLPIGTYAGRGGFGGLTITNTDPVGKLTVTAQGIIGDSASWRGGSVNAIWRGTRPSIAAEAFFASERPSRQRDLHGVPIPNDADYSGADAFLELPRSFETYGWVARLGGTAGSLSGTRFVHGTRRLGIGEFRYAMRQTVGANALTEGFGLHVDGGSSEARSLTRGIVNGSLSAYAPAFALGARIEASYGAMSAAAPAYEQFVLGGIKPPLFDAAILPQRIAMPALPVGVAGGRYVATTRASLTGLIFEPFAWLASAGDELHSWHRVLGAQTDLTFSSIPFVRLPTVHALLGAAYSLDAPFAYKTRVYLSVTLRP